MNKMTMGARVGVAMLELVAGLALGGVAFEINLLLDGPSRGASACISIGPFAGVFGIGIVNHMLPGSLSGTACWNLFLAVILGIAAGIVILASMEHHPWLLLAGWLGPVLVAWTVWNIGIAGERRKDEF